MKTKCYLLSGSNFTTITEKISYMLYSTHNVKMLRKISGINFLFAFVGDEKKFYPLMNKILAPKKTWICECGNHHQTNFDFCPWCGKSQ